MASVMTPSSHHRQTLAGPAPSMADQLPAIDFGFDELRDRMAKFTARFDAFIEQGRKRVLEERNHFRMNVAELQEDQRMKKKDIEIVQLKTNTHQHTMAKEAAEAREMQASIAVLSEQRDRQAAARDELRATIAAAQHEVDARLAAQAEHARRRAGQARFNVPELDFWVTNLCLRIEGAGRDDRLKFVFTHVDERDWDAEAWFELDTAARDFAIRHCRPKLEKGKVERVLDRANESRELVVLLKGMRELFAEAMRP
ncbi:hypothetical protein RB594_004519 [Gaeumannomyces avenae]